MIKKLPSQKYLKECFRYEAKTGKLFWKKRPQKHFCSNKEFKRWNTRHAGSEALAYPKDNIYKVGALDGVAYSAHRVIWKLVTSKEPPAIIDHRDRNGFNNRWKNLRAASHEQNFINRVSSWAVSGIIGVRQLKNGRWNARIHQNKKYIHLGCFSSKKEAAKARTKATRLLYGVFAP